MNNRTLLVTTSLVTALLFIVHLADDIMLGIEQGDINDMRGGTAISVVLLTGILLGNERRWGHVIMFVSGLLGTAVSYLHFSGRGVGRFVEEPNGFRFIATLLVMGVAGAMAMIFAARGLWQSRRAGGLAQRHAEHATDQR